MRDLREINQIYRDKKAFWVWKLLLQEAQGF
jgi:hypothetical protein